MDFDSNLQVIAKSIFSNHGVDFTSVKKAGGWSNAVWISESLVLRLATTKGNNRLLREAQLASTLPEEVGYPKILDSGVTSGFAWTLAQRIPGDCLGEVWSTLHSDMRIIALQQLWHRVHAVHMLPLSQVVQYTSNKAWFNNTDAELAKASLLHLEEENILHKDECAEIRDTLARFWHVLPHAPHVLNHGDLTLDNAIWHTNRVEALIDFEFALISHVQLDLNHLVKCAYSPHFSEFSYDKSDSQGSQNLQEAVKEIALPMLVQPEEKVLLIGHAILLELWLLESWLEHPEGEGPLEEWDPLNRLRSLANGKGGYLSELMEGGNSNG